MADPNKDQSQCQDGWKKFIRHFSMGFSSSENNFRSVPYITYPQVNRSKKKFPTGSEYEGSWNILGMSGYGVYTFPNGVIYRGEFDDGTFHGFGELQYPNGIKLHGRFRRGSMVERSIVFGDGVEHGVDWQYCRHPDRRFTRELSSGLEPAGRSYMTAEQPSLEVPPGHYDTGDGFYNPDTRFVLAYSDLSVSIRAVSEKEHRWIIENCRKNPMENVGAMPPLYEEWSEPELRLPKEKRLVKPEMRTQYVGVVQHSKSYKDDGYVALQSESDISSETSTDSENETYSCVFH